LVRVWVQDWRIQTLREAEVRPTRTVRGLPQRATFRYRFSSVDPLCGKPDRPAQAGQTLVFLFNRETNDQPFDFLTRAEHVARDLDDRF
jgi:hypothetical protein